MSSKHVGSSLALTVISICLGVATLGFCSVIPLASSAATNVVVHPLSVKGLSSTTLDDPAASNVEKSLFADCGVSNVNRMVDGKIVGGVETAPNEFPWQAYLQVELESGRIYSCTGSLVSERWILTAAAECATLRNEKTRSILVYLGLHNRWGSSTEKRMYEGLGLLVHSGWNLDTMSNNIALVYLATSVTFTQYIRPVCLANPIEPSYAGEYATVAGWGSTSDVHSSTASLVLRKVTVPVISNAQCSSYYGYIADNKLCTSGANSSGICNGDSGAPLIFKQLDGTWKQIGIGSFISSQGCQAGSPTGYTRLSSYSTWVQQIIAPGSDFSTTPLMIRTTTTPIETTPTTTVTTTNSAPTQQAPTFECGRPKFTSRITEGSEALPGEFPWMAHFQMIGTDGLLFYCGGTFISDRHVLTAGHCIENEPNTHLGLNTIVNITLGAHDINKDDGHHQQFGWEYIVTYGINYGVTWNWNNDVAIVSLSRPVNFTDYVQPACLPFEDDLDHVNDSVVLTGWGQHDSSGSFSSVLRKTETTVISSFGTNGQCQQAAGIGNYSGDNVICSDGSQGHRFRYGDDGGPMNYYNAECGRWFILGVAGRGNSFDDGINRPNVFTRVQAHLELIQSNTRVSSPADCSSTTNGIEPTTTPGPTTSTTQKITTTSTEKTKTSTTTASTTDQPVKFSCAGKPNGNYPNPESSCSNTFYACSNENAYLFNCASNLVYREEIGVCDWPSNVAGCY